MSTTFDRPSPHPVLACVGTIDAALSETADVEVTYMSPEDKHAALLQLSRAEARLAALKFRVMASSDEVAAETGARDVAALVTHETRSEAGANRRDLALAEALDARWRRVEAALGAGDINVAQARVIAHALDELPAEKVCAVLLARAEEHLVEQAAHFGPRELRHLGRRVLEVIAPVVAEQHEAEQLAAEEERAWRRTSLVSTRLGDGTTRFVIKVPDAVATRVHTYLEAFTSPRHLATVEGVSTGEGSRIPIEVRRGHAFCTLMERVDPKRLPVHGGDATTVIVTVPLQTLREGVGSAAVGPGAALSPGEVRRLACTAGIIPAVLGGASEVLDLGRESRFFKSAQRKAMVVRDKECRAEGCTVPAAWCEGHHWKQPWAKGGRTDLDDGVLLCSWHHHRAHDEHYDFRRLPSGDVRFTRRR